MKKPVQFYNPKRGYIISVWDDAAKRYKVQPGARPDPWPGVDITGQRAAPVIDEPPKPETLQDSGYDLADW